MELIARATDLTGYGPINTDELHMLRRGNFTDNSGFIATFGFEPMPFSQGIAVCPRSGHCPD
jgi:hypothetical protein